MKSLKFLPLTIFLLLILGCSDDSNAVIDLPIEDTIAPVVSISFTDASNNTANTPMIVNDQLVFTVAAEDAGDVAKVEVFINDEKVAEDTNPPFEFTINVYSFSSKTSKSFIDYNLKVVATDTAGNETVIEQTIHVPKKLIIINFPSNEHNPERNQLYVFASNTDGSLLAIEELQANQNSIALYTEIDIPDDLEYTLTIAEKNNAFHGETNELTSIQNINYATLKEINLKTRPRFSTDYFSYNTPLEFPLEGFWDTNSTELTVISGTGRDFKASSLSNSIPLDTTISLVRYPTLGNGLKTDKLYLQFINIDLKTAEYTFLERDSIHDGFVLSKDLFGTSGMTLEQYTFPNFNTAETVDPSVHLYGYDTDFDYENNIFYNLDPYDYGGTDSTIYNYWFNSNFKHYITDVEYLQYAIKHVGKPYAEYLGKEWTLSHSFYMNEFTLDKNTADEDFVGTIFISDDFYRDLGGPNTMLNGREGTYSWNILFNSQNTTTVALPQIPEELKNWVFNDKYLNEPIGTTNELGQRRVELIRYEGLSSYEDYLQEVVKDNKKWYLVSPARESVLDNPSVWSTPVRGFRYPFD